MVDVTSEDQAEYYKRSSGGALSGSEVSEIKELTRAIEEHTRLIEVKLDRLISITERLAMHRKLGLADYD